MSSSPKESHNIFSPVLSDHQEHGLSEPVVISTSGSARKRKHDEDEEPESYQGALSQNDFQLNPRLLLHRSALPLSFLNPNGGSPCFQTSSIFSAPLPQQEAANTGDEASEMSIVIIAECDADGALYAVERLQAETYAFCQLADWVSVEFLKNLPSPGSCGQYTDRRQRLEGDFSEWWSSAALEPISTYKSNESQGRGNRFFKLQMKCPYPDPMLETHVHQETTSYGKLESVTPLISEPAESSSNLPIPEQHLPTSHEILDLVKTQYQEALYRSKSSLAYFAKGPLSRARAIFSDTEHSTDNVTVFATFLRTLVLNVNVIDRKYRETIPRIIDRFPRGYVSQDGGKGILSKLRKASKKAQKKTIGKDGLYSGEEVQVGQWWLVEVGLTSALDGPFTTEDISRKVLLEQKARETELQVILILEVLALEESTLATVTQDMSTAATKSNDVQSKEQKAKKPQNLQSLLEMLLDRLCIWQSMATEESQTAANQGRKASADESSVMRNPSADHLREFCVDVVLPFYGARTPETCRSVCQKLGGPMQPSPGRPLLRKTASSSHAPQKPGAAVQRPQNRRPRRTLERVLTDDRSASQRLKPSLLRSVTESDLPKFKREHSDPPLTAIPLNNTAVHKTKRYSQREVDLTVVSQAAQAKLKKRATVEKELQGAIATLKRPNPRMAVKDLVEAADKRVAESTSKKCKKSIRNLSAFGVQVMATPSANRRERMLTNMPIPRQPADSDHEESVPIPTSRVIRVPSSSTKGVVYSSPGSKRSNQFLNYTVQQTPTRGSSRFSNLRISQLENLRQCSQPQSLLLPSTGDDPPADDTMLNNGETFSRDTFAVPSNFLTTPSKNSMFHQEPETPVKDIENTPARVTQMPTNEDEASSIVCSASCQDERDEGSIYARLGWDDDLEELV